TKSSLIAGPSPLWCPAIVLSLPPPHLSRGIKTFEMHDDTGGESRMTAVQHGQSGRAERLAVLLGTYNGARFLDAQLRSVIAQDWPLIDVVASDDESTDGTTDLLTSWRDIWNKGSFTIMSG